MQSERQDAPSTARSYAEERQTKTLGMGRAFAALAIVSVPAFALWDTLLFGTKAFLGWGIAGLFPALLFLIGSFTFLRERRGLIIPLHLICQFGIMVMASGYTFTTYLLTKAHLPPGGGSPAVLATALFIVIIFGGGGRPFFAAVAIPPLLAVTIALVAVGGVPLSAVAHLSTAWVFAIAGIVVGWLQERIVRNEYRMRLLARQSKEELEREVEHVRSLNERLEREIEERKAMEAELERRAAMDDLTDVYNRRAGMEILRQSFYLAERNSQPLSVCFVDVDDLKLVNDNYGHAEGDRLLQRVITVLGKHLRKSDYVARIGGDEFLMVLPNCARESAQDITDRIREELEASGGEGLPYPVSISMGIAEYAGKREVDPETLMREADGNMYRSKQTRKHSGRHQG